MADSQTQGICFFASYYSGTAIPYYVTAYLRELRKYVSRLVFISSVPLSETDKKFLSENTIDSFFAENEGYDFGAWYKAMRKYSPLEYERLLLVNDSCILFKPLGEFITWSEKNPAEVQGMTISEAVSPHVQSYFLLLKKPAIAPALEYFETHKVQKNLKDVINTYEIGLSAFLQSKGFRMAAFTDNKGYRGEHSPYYYCTEHHLSQGIPVIKKKIIFSSYRKDELFTLARMNFNISATHYISLIKAGDSRLIIDFEKLQPGQEMTAVERVKYNVTRLLIRLFRPLYKLVRKND